jgi:hypothetical protein
MDKAQEILHTALKHRDIESEPEIRIRPIGASAQKLRISFWIKRPDGTKDGSFHDAAFDSLEEGLDFLLSCEHTAYKKKLQERQRIAVHELDSINFELNELPDGGGE